MIKLRIKNFIVKNVFKWRYDYIIFDNEEVFCVSV